MPALLCAKDKAVLPQPIAAEDTLRCGSCRRTNRVHLFPAFLGKNRKQSSAAEKTLSDSDASCFYHPELKATAICDDSGRFICANCTIDWRGATLSFEALRKRQQKASDETLITKALMWDDVALTFAILPIFVYPFLIFTAPATLFIVIWKWKAGPFGVIRKSRFRMILAGLIALLEIAGMVGLGFLIAANF